MWVCPWAGGALDHGLTAHILCMANVLKTVGYHVVGALVDKALGMVSHAWHLHVGEDYKQTYWEASVSCYGLV